MPVLPICNTQGKQTENLDLPDSIFGNQINKNVLHQASLMYQAAQRQGTASTKERGMVSGGGKKPYRQKGTGRARAGSNRSPLWHKGGVVFGPHPRDFSYSIPRKIKIAALRESINAKLLSQDLLCIEAFEVTSSKTKDFARFLLSLNLKGKILALLDQDDSIEQLQKVSRNIPYFHLMLVKDVNAYDVLRNKKLLVTKAAFKNLLERIK